MKNETTMNLNQTEMLKYISDFDVLRHKFLYMLSEEEDINHSILDKMAGAFSFRGRKFWNMDQAVNSFLTMDKVYHYGGDRAMETSDLLDRVIEKFLREYVNIEGMEELFQSSYFYFEWMMHLEYMEERHDYSFYRDHYVHQIRNLYEMFMLLDKEINVHKCKTPIWRRCMDIYKQRSDRVAVDMRDSVRQQISKKSPEMSILQRMLGGLSKWNFEECCFHYIIFATAIVASLVHDIGYPIVFMKRNMERVQGFLPMSHIFMDMSNNIPKVKSLLSNSLLFATIGEEKIQRRLEKDDHGAYSAIILLYQYYDNGKIFDLDPTKRMVVELSALVIYNHTLKYAYQDKKKYDYVHNVFGENPISYLFRLCDDLQEWERVYFLISEKSAFFICDKCKTPMVRIANKRHVYDRQEEQKMIPYTCVCGAKGWNSLWFPYRRMINVSPFTGLTILEQEIVQENKNQSKEKKERWIFKLKCDKKALLQLAHYNDTFAIQRLRGIRELREMTKGQKELPDICVKGFVSNNPIAIKVRILEEFIGNYVGVNSIDKVKNVKKCFEALGAKYINATKTQKEKVEDSLRALKKNIGSRRSGEKICALLEREFFQKHDERVGISICEDDKFLGDSMTKRLMMESVEFYLFLTMLGNIACKKEMLLIKDEKNIKKYEDGLSTYCNELAQATATVWNIRNHNMIALMTDCFVLMHCDICDNKSFWESKSKRYQVRYPLRQDICDIVRSYVDERDYMEICETKNRQTRSGEMIFDFYSDYYFYFVMDICTERRVR